MLRFENIYALPILHHTMEFACEVVKAIDFFKPTCIAVELPETENHLFQRAASRLPDISVIVTGQKPLYTMIEPCDPLSEALRSAIDHSIDSYCIDLSVENYPEHLDLLPDPYALTHIGLKSYYEAYQKSQNSIPETLDAKRELYMAKRLKELSLCYERVLFVGGFYHVKRVLDLVSNTKFPQFEHVKNESDIATLNEESCAQCMAESSWITKAYEEWRLKKEFEFPLDRQKLLFDLYQAASKIYTEKTGSTFTPLHFRNLMKYVRNLCLLKGRLMPTLYEILIAAKGCVDSNFSYEVWHLATDYPNRKNIDNLKELPLTVDEVWGHSKRIFFQLKQKGHKSERFEKRKKNSNFKLFYPPSPYSLCSYPLEDVVIEKFGEWLKKKGGLVEREKANQSIPFSTSLEEGLDLRETVRRWHEKKLYVQTKGKTSKVNALVVIFDEDEEDGLKQEKYPWKMSWLGEHSQESDMAYYASPLFENIVGPGISRCEYGGFMMTSPPRRLRDVWSDPDYEETKSKAEVLLKAAIDYATTPFVVYVGKKPPSKTIKQFASSQSKKVIYFPINQLSQVVSQKIKFFHVLDGHDKRKIAGDFIF